MINLAAIDHIVFRVKDMAAMIRFYEDVLGARVEREVPEFGLLQLRAGSSLIDLIQRGPDEDADGRNVDHVCFRVAPWDGDAICAHLGSHGISDVEIASRYGAEGQGPSIYISDPEGNVLELKGPPWPHQS